MLDDLKILSMASALARHSAQRHQTLAENIANADTPGYKAQDIESFSDAVKRAGDSQESMTALGSGDFHWRVNDIVSAGLTSPNGNTVSLEDQMMRSIEAQQNHEAATAIYKKTMDIIRLSLGRGM